MTGCMNLWMFGTNSLTYSAYLWIDIQTISLTSSLSIKSYSLIHIAWYFDCVISFVSINQLDTLFIFDNWLFICLFICLTNESLRYTSFSVDAETMLALNERKWHHICKHIMTNVRVAILWQVFHHFLNECSSFFGWHIKTMIIIEITFRWHCQWKLLRTGLIRISTGTGRRSMVHQIMGRHNEGTVLHRLPVTNCTISTTFYQLRLEWWFFFSPLL